MTLRALIFDVDGTLADTEEAHRQAFNQAFARHGLAWHWSAREYRILLEVTGGKERLVHYIASLGLSAAEQQKMIALLPDLHATKTRCYSDLVADGQVPLRPGVLALISAARRAGLQLAIASTTSPENVSALVTSAWGDAADGVFDVIATGDVVGRKKPAPDIYELALLRLQLAPTDCVAFEDSAAGVQAARAAALCVVATPSQWTDEQDLAGATLLVPSLEGLGLQELGGLCRDSQRGLCHAAAD
jgi:HAD superfamily hydrolase (TIGR01509 family)